MLIKFCFLRSSDFYLIKCVAPTLRGALNSLSWMWLRMVIQQSSSTYKIEFAFALRTVNCQKYCGMHELTSKIWSFLLMLVLVFSAVSKYNFDGFCCYLQSCFAQSIYYVRSLSISSPEERSIFAKLFLNLHHHFTLE